MTRKDKQKKQLARELMTEKQQDSLIHDATVKLKKHMKHIFFLNYKVFNYLIFKTSTLLLM